MTKQQDRHESLVLEIANEMQQSNGQLVPNQHNLYGVYVPAARVAVKRMEMEYRAAWNAVYNFENDPEFDPIIQKELIERGLITPTKTTDNG